MNNRLTTKAGIMKVWGHQTKGMDHLRRRAESLIRGTHTEDDSEASSMDDLSMTVQRDVLNHQRERGRIFAIPPRKKNRNY
ncbi:MAG: hypothetical protein JKY27_07375 [Magnetovibrio sp.]|nr:hypothetical protein [Magnetovibrio sp.]